MRALLHLTLPALALAAGCAAILGIENGELDTTTSDGSGGGGAEGGGGVGGVGGVGGEAGAGGTTSAFPSWCDDGVVIFEDQFERDMSMGWGVPVPGPAPPYYTLRGGNTLFSVDSAVGEGKIKLTQTRGRAAVDIGAHEELEIAAQVALNIAPQDANFRGFGSLALRDDDSSSFYEARLLLQPADDTIKLQLNEVSTQAVPIDTVTIDTAPAAGQHYHVRFRVEGFGPVTLMAAAWPVDASPPAEWTISGPATTVKTGTFVGPHGGSPDATPQNVYAHFDNLMMCVPSGTL
jgi:hypothetical protein